MRRFVLSTLTIASTCYVHGAPATDRASHIAELRILDPTYDPGYEYHPYPVDAVEKSLRPNTGVNAVPLSLDTPKPAVMLKLDDLDAGTKCPRLTKKNITQTLLEGSFSSFRRRL
jgi:hypothetical protein